MVSCWGINFFKNRITIIEIFFIIKNKNVFSVNGCCLYSLEAGYSSKDSKNIPYNLKIGIIFITMCLG